MRTNHQCSMIFLKHSFAIGTERVLTFAGFQPDNIMGRCVEKEV